MKAANCQSGERAARKIVDANHYVMEIFELIPISFLSDRKNHFNAIEGRSVASRNNINQLIEVERNSARKTPKEARKDLLQLYIFIFMPLSAHLTRSRIIIIRQKHTTTRGMARKKVFIFFYIKFATLSWNLWATLSFRGNRISGWKEDEARLRHKLTAHGDVKPSLLNSRCAPAQLEFSSSLRSIY